MAKSRAKAVADAQAKVLAAGGERLTLTLPPGDAARWRSLVARQGSEHGAKMAAFRDAIEAALNGGEPTPAQALRVLARLVKGAA